MNYVRCIDGYIVNTIYGIIFYYYIRKNENLKSPETAKGYPADFRVNEIIKLIPHYVWFVKLSKMLKG